MNTSRYLRTLALVSALVIGSSAGLFAEKDKSPTPIPDAVTAAAKADTTDGTLGGIVAKTGKKGTIYIATYTAADGTTKTVNYDENGQIVKQKKKK